MGRGLARELDVVLRELGELRERVKEIDSLRRRILKIMDRLNPLNCTLDYRWVKGNGGVYRYYYCVWYEGGKRRQSYVGKVLPEGTWERVRDKHVWKRLARELRLLDKTERELWEAIVELERLVSHASSLASRVSSVEAAVEWAEREVRAGEEEEVEVGEGVVG